MQKSSMMFAAALAGLLAAGCSKGNETPKTQTKPTAGKVKCEGINTCAGHGGCAGGGHECAGKNGCKGQGWMEVASAEECTTKGGKVI